MYGVFYDRKSYQCCVGSTFPVVSIESSPEVLIHLNSCHQRDTTMNSTPTEEVIHQQEQQPTCEGYVVQNDETSKVRVFSSINDIFPLGSRAWRFHNQLLILSPV